MYYVSRAESESYVYQPVFRFSVIADTIWKMW